MAGDAAENWNLNLLNNFYIHSMWIYVTFPIYVSLVSWGCRIHQQHLWIGERQLPSNKCLGYDIKQSDGEAPDLEIWRMWSTPSLPLLLGSLWPRVVTPDRVLSMGQIEQTMCANKSLLWLLYSNTWNLLTVCKKRAQAHSRMVSTKCVYKLYIYLICIYKEVLALNNLQWLICHEIKPNLYVCVCVCE